MNAETILEKPENTAVSAADGESEAGLKTVTIFMATLNEIDGVRDTLPRISPDWYDEIIVVDGGSTDGTVEYLRERGIEVQQEERKGVVNAYCQGFDATTGDIFIVFAPDGNCIPELIPELVRELRNGHDVVSASRYLPPAKSYDDDVVTAFGNFFFTRLVNLLFSARHSDLLGSYRAYRRSAVLQMRLNTQRDDNWLTRRYDLLNTWEVGGGIRAAKLGLSMKDIPGDEPARIGGARKMSIIRNGIALVAQITYELLIGRRFLRK